jgi:hypothetical protein
MVDTESPRSGGEVIVVDDGRQLLNRAPKTLRQLDDGAKLEADGHEQVRVSYRRHGGRTSQKLSLYRAIQIHHTVQDGVEQPHFEFLILAGKYER